MQVFLLHATVALSMVAPELAKACIELRKKLKRESPAFSSFMRHNLSLLFNIAIHYNKITPLHRDLDSSPFSLDHIGAAGFFQGAELYFSCANIIVPFQPFDLCLIRGFCLMHGVCAIRGGIRRFSVATFLNKHLFEHYDVPIPHPSKFNIHVVPPNFEAKAPKYQDPPKTIDEKMLKMNKVMKRRLEREQKGEYGNPNSDDAESSTKAPSKRKATRKKPAPPPPTTIHSPDNSPPRKRAKRATQSSNLVPHRLTPSSSQVVQSKTFNDKWNSNSDDSDAGDGARTETVNSDVDSDTLEARVYEKYIRRELAPEVPEAFDAPEDSEVCQRWVQLGLLDQTSLPDFVALMDRVRVRDDHAGKEVQKEHNTDVSNGNSEGEAGNREEDVGNEGDDESNEGDEIEEDEHEDEVVVSESPPPRRTYSWYIEVPPRPAR